MRREGIRLVPARELQRIGVRVTLIALALAFATLSVEAAPVERAARSAPKRAAKPKKRPKRPAKPKPPVETPPAETTPVETPPAETPPAEPETPPSDPQSTAPAPSESGSKPATEEPPVPPPPPPDEPPKDFVTLNGGFWLNYRHRLFDPNDRDKLGDFGPGSSMFRLGADARKNGIIGSVRLRWYSYARMWEYGWIGYRWANNSELQVGMIKVPFGILPYASFDYWFDIPYYLGFNSQYDTGIKWSGDLIAKRLNVEVGAFKNSDIAAADDLNRFSYDVVTVSGNPAASNELIHHGNARLALKLGPVELGASGQYGRLYNYDTRKQGPQWSAAAHLAAEIKGLSLQLQAKQYSFKPRNAAGVPTSSVYVGGFADAFPIASEAQLAELNVAYRIALNSWIGITLYNNHSLMRKREEAFADSEMNSAGFSIAAGPIFAMIDVISAKNGVYLGAPSDVAFVEGEPDAKWHSMFNFNLGFYYWTRPLPWK